MISLIVACTKKLVIGINNKIPWHISEDFKHFKNYTLNKTILMGKNTYFSIGKPLPMRKTIVVCNDEELIINHPDVVVKKDLFEVLNEYKNKNEELVVCGGAMIYKLSLPYVDKLIISEIKNDYEGDAFFPTFYNEFTLISSEDKKDFIIKIYERRK